jgi:hypothetical protein
MAPIPHRVEHQYMKCSAIWTIPSVLSDDYTELMFLAARQFRDNYSSRLMLLLSFVQWSNLANLPLAICFGEMSILNCPFLCLWSVLRGYEAGSSTIASDQPPLYEWVSVFKFTQFQAICSIVNSCVAIGSWYFNLRAWCQGGGDAGE